MTLLVVLYALRSSRPRLRVEVHSGTWQDDAANDTRFYVTSKKPALTAASNAQVMVFVSNLGHVPVTVSRLVFRSPRHYQDIIILFRLEEGTISMVTFAPQDTLYVFVSGQKLSKAGVARIDTAAACDIAGNVWLANTRLIDRIARSFFLVFGKGPAELRETESSVDRTVNAEDVYRHMGPRTGWSLRPAARVKKSEPDSGSGSS